MSECPRRSMDWVWVCLGWRTDKTLLVGKVKRDMANQLQTEFVKMRREQWERADAKLKKFDMLEFEHEQYQLLVQQKDGELHTLEQQLENASNNYELVKSQLVDAQKTIKRLEKQLQKERSKPVPAALSSPANVPIINNVIPGIHPHRQFSFPTFVGWCTIIVIGIPLLISIIVAIAGS